MNQTIMEKARSMMHYNGLFTSCELDEREVNKTYITSMTGKTEVIDVIKVIDEVAQPESEKELPVEDEPMESAADPF
ncbi:unnamed protein product [Peronospora farinosa]|uniref:Uncharacterized protein n=1 Tax=Peronospora farinosa TaxID=134698 RepID=A0AAV0SSB8_9STRA|nr:unnamed protein product [Peronospora farinosa]